MSEDDQRAYFLIGYENAIGNLMFGLRNGNRDLLKSGNEDGNKEVTSRSML